MKVKYVVLNIKMGAVLRIHNKFCHAPIILRVMSQFVFYYIRFAIDYSFPMIHFLEYYRIVL